MSVVRMADDLHRFLASHGMDAKGVRVTIEFDEPQKAMRAWDCLRRDLSTQLAHEIIEPPKVDNENWSCLKAIGIPFKFIARIG